MEQIETEIGNRAENLEELQNRCDTLTEEISNPEAEIEALEDQEYREIFDIHEEVNQLKSELGQLENEPDNVKSGFALIEDSLIEKEHLEAQWAEGQSELEDLWTHIDQIEQQAVEEFNDHMGCS